MISLIIKFIQSVGVLFTLNEFFDISCEGIYLTQGSSFTIKNNHMYSNGFNIEGNNGGYMYSGIIQNNFFAGDLYISGGSGGSLLIENNIILGNMDILEVSTPMNDVHIYVYNNIINTFFFRLESNHVTNMILRIEQNIILNSIKYRMDSDIDVSVSYNRFEYVYQNYGTYPLIGLGEMLAINPNGTICDTYFNIDAPPDFVDSTYYLNSTSPCINAGNPENFDDDGTIADIGPFPYYHENQSPPIIDFYINETLGNSPLPVQFNYINTGGSITNYLWDFGDGSTSTLANPVHTYSSDIEQSFTVSLSVTGPGGSDTIEHENCISVIPISYPPSSNFSSNTQTSYGEIQFSSISNGQIDSFNWDFGDGNTSNEKNPFHIYSNPGLYTVSLTISGPTGTDIEIKENYIEILSPEDVQASFDLQLSGNIAPVTVTFSNSSIGTIDGYLWDFGNGETSTNLNPTYTYQEPGIYTITLTANGLANNDSVSQTISIESAAATITSILDVPDDQGGWVYIDFDKSGHDTDTPNRTEMYTIERNDSDVWTAILSLAAYGQETYRAYISTLTDSTSNTNALSNFRIISSMDEGNWISNELSGYSVDNIAPLVPSGLFGTYENNSISLQWDESEDIDFSYYDIFKDGEYLISTIDNTYVDENPNLPATYYLAAYDVNENQSENSEPVTVSTSLLGDLTYDSEVNILDIVFLVEIIINVFTNDYIPSEIELQAADIYEDGQLNVIDIVGLVNIVLDN